MLGISSVADQRSTKRVESRQPLSLTALGANLIGFALQVVALNFGSLALVQPILVCDLVFAVLILWFVRRRPGTGHARQAGIVFAGVAATVIGLAGFLAIGRPSSGTTQVSLGALPPLAVGLVVVVGGCLAVAARNRSLRPLALALACGVSYGVAAFLIKLVTSEFGGGAAQVFTN